MYIKILVQVDAKYQEFNAKKIGENTVIYCDGHQVLLVKVLPTTREGIYIQDSGNVVLADHIHIIKEEDILEDIEVVLKEVTLFDYLSKIKQPIEDYNFELVDKGGYRTRKF